MTDLTKKAETDLIKNIDNLRDNYKLADIEELIIEDIPLERISEKVKQKLEELKFLESLSFNKCSLVSLDNLPTLPNLVRITLDHNKLNGSEIEKLSIYKGLISLSIMDNNIEDINGFGSM